jgi:23S rRNA (uridine2552-2'-O)-methyltransferase
MASKKSSGTRSLKTRVKTAKSRSVSSARWLSRQLNDPYVVRAKKEGYRSRAAFKLLELDDKYKFLKPGKIVLDLGAAPGGWTQGAVERTKSTEKKPLVVAIDILPMSPINGATVLQLDFSKDEAPDVLRKLLPNGADIVLSDIAPNTTGHSATDHLRIMALLEMAYDFAIEVLHPGGVFLGKIWQGGAERDLLKRMKSDFAEVRHVKPKASRADSSEMYVMAIGFRK